MIITKYGHACLTLQEDGKKIIIDPGKFTEDYGGTEGIDVIVVTHIHADHFNEQHVRDILAANPQAVLYTTPEVATELNAPQVTAVQPNFTAEHGPFTLRFLGEQHATIHPSFPVPQNTAVFINDLFYYPGDSFTPPDKPVHILAVPANAPWAKVQESMDFITHAQPKQVIPVHNGLLSDAGHQIYNGALEAVSKAIGAQFTFLRPHETIEY